MEWIAVVLLAAGFTCFGASAYYYYRENRRLRATNDRLRDLNHRLRTELFDERQERKTP